MFFGFRLFTDYINEEKLIKLSKGKPLLLFTCKEKYCQFV
jgi:hypothetical protein